MDYYLLRRLTDVFSPINCQYEQEFKKTWALLHATKPKPDEVDVNNSGPFAEKSVPATQ